MRKLSLFFLLVLQVTGFSADIYWVKLKPNFTYKDLSLYCTTVMGSTDVFLAIEANKGKVTRAILRKNLSFPWESVEFSPKEVADLQIKVSSENVPTIEEMALEEKSIVWVLSHGGGGDLGCHPSQPIQTLNPSTYVFKFGARSDSMLKKESFSNGGTFSGKLKNGDSFQAELMFLQSPL